MDKEKFKALIVDGQIYYGGGETYKLDIAEIFKDKNINVTFSTPEKGIFAKRIKELGYEFIPFTPTSRLDVIGMYNYAKRIKKNNYDIIITSDSHSWYSGVFLKKICKPKLIAAVVHISTAGTGKNFGFLKKLAVRIVDKIWTNYHHKVICSTNFHADIYRKENVKPEKLMVIHNAVNREKILNNISENGKEKIQKKFDIPRDKLVISMFGRFGPGKDFHNLVKAIPYVLKETDNFVFVLVGDGPYFDEIKKMVSEMNLESRVRFTGFVKEDYYNLMDMVDIFVNSTIAEGVSYVVLDAMALGKPIVATDSGGIKEAVKNDINGILVPIKNPEKLAQAIIKLIDDKQLRGNLSKGSLNIQRENFSLEQMTKNFEELFEKYLSEK